jgi:UDP-glucose 4-epimerase
MVGDLKDPEVALKAVDGVSVVSHLAANPEVRVGYTSPEVHFRENVVVTFNILEAARRRGIGEIVFASSSSVYGEPDFIPVGEDAPLRPVSVYGASKASCESLIHAYTKLYGLRAVVLRYANIVGPRMRHGVVWDFIVKLRGNSVELEVLGDGSQVRSYMHVLDAVEATITAWSRGGGGYQVYNVASEDWIAVNEVADIVVEAMGLKDVRKIHKPALHGVGWPGDVKRIALKIDRLKSIGFKPRISSREAVRTAVEELLEELKANP